MPQLLLTTLPNIPHIGPGDDLIAIILRGLDDASIVLTEGDALVLASKIVSKVEGRVVPLQSVEPGERAKEIAQVVGKDEREVELMLRESTDVVRARKGLIVTRHRLGFISANAGLDHSNVDSGDESVILLPLNPDESARRLRMGLEREAGVNVGVIIADSHGRPHRMGTIGVAIGVAGLPALEDWRGREDLFGYVLQHTEVGLGDMIASAATLLLGQAREGTPIVHIRGLPLPGRSGSASELVRPKELDLFL